MSASSINNNFPDLVIGSRANDTLVGHLGRDIVDTGEGDNVVFADRRLDLADWSLDISAGKDEAARLAYDRAGALALDAAIVGAMSPDGKPLTQDQIDSLADVVNGGTGVDVIFAGLGNDTLNGGGGNDRVFAGAGEDVASGGSGDDLVDGGAGNDILQGEEGADTLLGGDGADHLFGGAGADVLDGENGNDLLIGGNEADIARGDVLRGGAGQDFLYGEGGQDTLDGGDGGDRLDGGSGNDSLFGGEGTDALSGGAGADTLDGGAGADGLDGGAGADLLTGGAGADTLNGGAGADTLLAGAGDDLAIYRFDPGQTAADSLIGGEGSDTLRLLLSADQFALYRDLLAPYLADGLGGATIDFSALASAAAGSISLVASGFETLEIYVEGIETGATQRRDGLFTVAADAVDFDALDAGARPGFDAGDGNDVVALASRATNVAGYDDTRFFLAGKGNDALSGRDRDDKIDAGAGNDTLWGGAGNDTLLGGAGGDRLLGEGGIDSVGAGAGNDVIGLAGADTVNFDGRAYLALWGTVDGGAGADRLDGASRATLVIYDAERDNVRDIESFAFGSGGDVLSLEGYGSADGRYSIAMEAGDDYVFGTLGHDMIRGGTGDDFMSGGSGRDTLLGEAGADSLDGGGGADLLNGGDGNDFLSGEDGDDVLFGEAGDDSLLAGAGSNALYGGAGNDVLFGSSRQDDRAVLFGDDGDDELIAGQGSDALFGGAGNDHLSANGGDVLFGDAGDDDLDAFDGTAGGNSLYGGAGADTLSGGADNDSLDGGDGADIAVYSGARADYNVAYDAASDSFVIRDLRPGAGFGLLDGTDTVHNVESFVFDDGGVSAEDLKTTGVVTGAAAVTWTDLSQTGGDMSGYTVGGRMLSLDFAGDDDLTGGAGADWLLGRAGNDTLSAKAGDDTLDGGAGADLLTGGAGLDNFIIQQGFGRDTITDFGASPGNQDVLLVSSAVFADMQAFMAAARQVGTDVVIAATPNDVLTLKNIALSSLDATDLRFTPSP